jgi:hypothetical protein
MAKEPLFILEHRDLSVKEADLISWLLGETNHSELKEQLRDAKVISKCGCGCPTIDLQVDGYEDIPVRLVLSAEGLSPEGIPVGVILHVRHGLLSELEVYSQDGTKEFSLPEVDTLKTT